MNSVEITYYSYILLSFAAIHIGLYRIFEKAGEKGWQALVPVLNYWVLLRIVGRPKWWLILAFVPVVNLVVPFLLLVDICKSFGKDGLGAQTLAMLLPNVYLPYIGFHNATRYEGQGVELYKGVKKGAGREWADAIIFALIAATFVRTLFIEAYKIPTSSMERTMLIGDHLFVSKFHYGARLPITPIAFPLAHHTMPLINTKAYTDLIQLPYFRLPGITSLQRNDVVVFNFPEGDTVVINRQNESYYDLLRQRNGRRYPSSEITVRPLDKRENYVKRCVAVAGDTLQIIKGRVHINGEPGYVPPLSQFAYRIISKTPLNSLFYDQLNLRASESRQIEVLPDGHGIEYVLNASAEAAEKMKSMPVISMVEMLEGIQYPAFKNDALFPNNYDNYPWDLDNYGPIWIPKKGATVTLTPTTMPLYKRIIQEYEGHDLDIRNGKVYIDGVETTTYTIEQNYYWMMGDNRHASQDSRFWGFVPEDHIVGKPWFIWFSRETEGDKGLFESIRWNRFMQFIK